MLLKDRFKKCMDSMLLQVASGLRVSLAVSVQGDPRGISTMEGRGGRGTPIAVYSGQRTQRSFELLGYSMSICNG